MRGRDLRLAMLLCFAWLGCAAARAEETEVSRQPPRPPASPLLRALAQSAGTPVDAVLQQDDSLPARLLALRLLPADPAMTPAVQKLGRLSFLRHLADTPKLGPADAPAVESFFSDLCDEWEAGDHRVDEPLLQAFRHAVSRHPLPALQIRASVRLAAWLWQKSCPIAGHDGACIERYDAWPQCLAARAELTRATKQKYPTADIELVDPCTEGPQFAYRVFPRNQRLASEAQQLLQSTLALAARRKILPQHPDDALADALAHAKFLRLEPHFEAQLAQPRYPGCPTQLDPGMALRLDRDDRTLFKHSAAQTWRWLQQRYGQFKSLRSVHERLYGPVLAFPGTQWEVAAHARIGEMLLDLATQIQGCQGVRVQPNRVSRAAETLVDCGSDDDMFAKPASEHLAECASWPREQGGLSQPVRAFCLDGLRSLIRFERRGLPEFLPPPPTSAPPTLDTAPVAPSL